MMSESPKAERSDGVEEEKKLADALSKMSWMCSMKMLLGMTIFTSPPCSLPVHICCRLKNTL